MKRMLLTISYDGTDYHGWQVQPNGITVQQVLQECLAEILGGYTSVTGCSRTDAGVHAKEFCCHIDCDEKFPPEAFTKGLNSILPKNIGVISCKEVASDFHARYNAVGKTYKYQILNSSVKDPFLLRYAWQIERPLNIEIMNSFCKGLIGQHDFAPFSSSARTVEDTVRRVEECFVERQGDMVTLTITANGFLYNMVRIIVGSAVDASFGRIDADAKKIFDSKRRDDAGITAPPQGLFLNKVLY